MKKKLISILATALLFFSCSSMKLERKLPLDIKDWYSLHQVLMNGKVPRWIIEGNHSERFCFLRIPEKAQRMYMSAFWEIRQEGLSDLFYNRVATANRFFTGEGKIGWKTDRGRVFILCGQPTVIHYYRDGQYINEPGMPGMEASYIQTWIYTSLRTSAYYTFKLSNIDTWRNTYGIRGNQVEFERKWRKVFSVTEDGWDLIGGWVLEWVKENKDDS